MLEIQDLLEGNFSLFAEPAFERGLTEHTSGAPGAGTRSIGLKAFVVERSESVRGQLEGTGKSSYGDGRGNRGSFGRVGLPNLPKRPR